MIEHGELVRDVLGSIEFVNVHRLGVVRKEHDVGALIGLAALIGRRVGVWECAEPWVIVCWWRDGGSGT